MGLIKTAMMTGAGLYAVNKVAKAAERQHSSSNPNNYPRDNPNGNQAYWGPPHNPPQNANYYGDYQQSPTAQDNRYPRGYSAENNYGDKPASEGNFQYQNRGGAPPPPAYQQQQYYQAQPQQEYGRDPTRGANVANLAGVAMEYLSDRKDDGKGKKSSSRINELFGR